VEAISQMLDAMGSTPDQVAETLRHARVRGMRDSTSFMNPVVRHLNRTLNIGGRLEVGAGGAVLRLQLEGKVREVPLPLPVQAFLDVASDGTTCDLHFEMIHSRINRSFLFSLHQVLEPCGGDGSYSPNPEACMTTKSPAPSGLV
jgi:hypothetical protein